MEKIITSFTEASSLQHLAAFVAIVWLLGMTGITRPKRIRGAPNASIKQMLLWFSAALLITSGTYLVLEEDFAEPSFTVPFSAELKKIDKVVDGDTIALSDGTRVRLHGIDTPERDQPYGSGATRQLNELIGRQILVEPIDTDRYGRLVAVIYTPEGLNVNLEMVCVGAAWWYERYAPKDAHFKECQRSAQESKLGLWDGLPIAPWEWRRKRSKTI